MTIKNGKLVLLMILVAGILIGPAYAQTNLTVYLGRDDFDNEKWVSSLDNTVVNITESRLLLNQTPNGHEDFTTWTEEDGAGRLVVNASHIVIDDMAPNDDDTRVYRDDGIDQIGDYFVTFELRLTGPVSTSSPRNKLHIFSATTDRADVGDNIGNYTALVLRSTVGDTSKFIIRNSGFISGVVDNLDTGELFINTDYWINVTKFGDVYSVYVYDDAGFSNLITSAVNTLTHDLTMRYFNIPNSLGFGSGGGQQNDLTIGNLIFNGIGGDLVYVPTGDFYSIDLLENASSPAIARSVYGVANLPPSTSIQLLHSSDNSSWIVEDLSEQFFVDLEPFNYSDLFIRYRLNTSNDQVTPDVDFYYITYDFTFTPGNISILAGSFQEYNVSSIDVLVGDYVHGNLTSTKFVDGKTYLVNEVMTMPGWDIRFNFTDVPENSTSLSVRSFDEYIGNPAHDAHMEAYHFDNGTWVDIVEYPEGSFVWRNHSLSLGGFIQEDTGNVWIRMVHHIQGVPGHTLDVDYIKLRAFVPTGGTINVDAWGINWLLMIIWLALVAIGVFSKNKIIIVFAGFFGIILAILMFTENMMVAVALISINLYLLYEGTA